MPAAVAWRLSTVEHRPELALERQGGRDALWCGGLMRGQAYVVQSSEDLIRWEVEEAFRAVEAEHRWSGGNGAGRRYYRLGATD